MLHLIVFGSAGVGAHCLLPLEVWYGIGRMMDRLKRVKMCGFVQSR